MASWELLGGNPVPGDAEWVRQRAVAFAAVVTEASVAREQLRGIIGQTTEAIWSGSAADAFRGHAERLLPALQLLISSYEEASNALEAFSLEMERLQAEARGALASGLRAQHDVAVLDAELTVCQDDLAQARAAVEDARRRAAELTLNLRVTSVPAPSMLEEQLRSQWSVALGGALTEGQSWAASAAVAETRVSEIEQSIAEANDRLRAARSTAAGLAEMFAASYRTAAHRLDDASGPHSGLFSFVGRLEADGARAFTDLGVSLIGSGALALVQGRFSTAEGDLKRVVAMDAPLLHEAAHLVRDVSSVTAQVCGDVAPVLLVAGLALCVVGFPEVGVVVLGLSEGVTELGTGASAVTVGADVTEVAADDAEYAVGEGNSAQTESDLGSTVTDGFGLATTSLLGSIGGAALPDINEAMQSGLDLTQSEVVTTSIHAGYSIAAGDVGTLAAGGANSVGTGLGSLLVAR